MAAGEENNALQLRPGGSAAAGSWRRPQAADGAAAEASGRTHGDGSRPSSTQQRTGEVPLSSTDGSTWRQPLQEPGLRPHAAAAPAGGSAVPQAAPGGQACRGAPGASWGTRPPTAGGTRAGDQSSWHAQPDPQGWRSEARLQGAGRATGGHLGAAGHLDPHGPAADPSHCRDLPELLELVQHAAHAWTTARNLARLRAGFTAALKLSGGTGEGPRLLPRVLALLAAAYRPLMPSFTHPAFCIVPLWVCVRAECSCGGFTDELLDKLQEGGCALMRRAGAQDCCNLLLACVRLGRGEAVTELLDAAVEQLVQQPRLNGQDLGNAFYALGKLRDEFAYRPCKPELFALAERLKGALQRMRQQQQEQQQQQGRGQDGGERSGRAAGGGSGGQEVEDEEELQRQRWGGGAGRGGGDRGTGGGGGGGADSGPGGADLTPQELSNALMGCEKLRFDRADLLQPLAEAAGRAARAMADQGLSISLHALVHLGCTGAAFRPAVEALALEAQERMEADAGLGGSRRGAPRVGVGGGGGRGGPARGGWKPQELSNVVRALAHLGYQDQGLYAAAVAAAVHGGAMAGATSQNWSNLWYALGAVSHRPEEGLLRLMADPGSGVLELLHAEAAPQACVCVLAALATLGLYHERLVDVLMEGLRVHLEGRALNAQDVSSCVWALAAMGGGAGASDTHVLERHVRVVEGLLQSARRMWEAGGTGPMAFETAALTQLWQGCVELREVGGAGGRAAEALMGCSGPRGQLKEAALHANTCRAPTVSPMQAEVAAALRRLVREEEQGAGGGAGGGGGGSGAGGMCVQEEVLVHEVCCRVDIVVVLGGGRRVAVEVDGPVHFLANAPREPNGNTQLRNRQLRRVFGREGLVVVPGWEWGEVRGAREAHYLRQLLGL